MALARLYYYRAGSSKLAGYDYGSSGNDVLGQPFTSYRRADQPTSPHTRHDKSHGRTPQADHKCFRQYDHGRGCPVWGDWRSGESQCGQYEASPFLRRAFCEYDSAQHGKPCCQHHVIIRRYHRCPTHTRVRHRGRKGERLKASTHTLSKAMPLDWRIVDNVTK